MFITKTRRCLFFSGLTIAVLAVYFAQYFDVLAPSVGRIIEPLAMARKPLVSADQELPAVTQSDDLPITSATAPMSEPTPAPVQATREEIATALVAFQKWAEVYAAASTEQKLKLTAKGVPLAEARGHAMAALIKQDPLAAIQALLPYPLRKALPPEIAAKIEHRVSGVGDLMVVAVNPLPGMVVAEPIYRTAKFADQKKYRAYVYGSRSHDISRTETRILGVGVKPVNTEALLAVREDAYEVLNLAEATDLDPDRELTDCPVSDNPTASKNDETAVDTGDKILWLCSGGHLSEWLQSPDGKLVAAAGGSGSSGGVSPVMPATWTQGHKKLLAIRVRFADQPVGFQPATDEAMQTELQKAVDYLSSWSYGKMTASFVFTHTFDLPGTEASYAAGGMDLINITRTIAAAYTDASGAHPYVSTNFAFDTVVFNAAWGQYGGVGYVGSNGTMVKSARSGLFLHEWGHNFGLWHASYWEPTTDSPIGAGKEEEYGNSYSTMGNSWTVGSYTTQERFLLRWLEPTNTTSVTTSGTYRVYNADTPNLTPNLNYALKLDNLETTYFIEYRPDWNPNTPEFATDNGAMILRQQYYHLIDMTPLSSGREKDASLLVGHSFHDPDYGVTVTPIARGGVAPNDYLDVVVNLDSSVANNPPVVVVTASNYTPAVNDSVNMTALAVDPDGDTLAYAWDFGDGGNMSADNSASQTKSWAIAGDYNVRCTVSDMKGKTVVQNLMIRVGSPSTFTISGRVTQPDGTPVQNVLVKGGSAVPAYTNADGRYSIGPLLSGSYTIIAFRDGWQLSAAAVRPLEVVMPVIDFNFTATPLQEPYGITQERWSNIDGPSLSSLKSHPDYPTKPTYTRLLTSAFEASNSVAGNYGQRISGFFIPPTTGVYTFYILADYESELYLSTNNLTANKQLIASTNGAGWFRVWDTYASQKSVAIPLTAGQHYYIEALHKEVSGLDYVSVGVDFPDGSTHYPIEATYLRPLPRTITLPPVSATTVSLAATDPSATEGSADTGTFTFTRSGSTASALTVFFNTTGTANYNEDYQSTGLSVVIPAGASTATILINPVEDTFREIDETITLQLVTTSTYALGLVTRSTVTILDSQLPEVSIAATRPVTTESGEENAIFTLIRTGSSAQAIVVNITSSGTATNGLDYPNLPTTVTIPAGQFSTALTVTAAADTLEEIEETVILSLLAGNGYHIKSPVTATGYILAQPLFIDWKLAENGNWSDSSKWRTDRPIAGGSLAYALNFNAAGLSYSPLNNLGDNFRLNQLNFGGGTATLVGNSLALSASNNKLPQVNQNSSNAVMIETNLALVADTSLGGIGVGELILSGIISGDGSLTKTTSGNLTLSGMNSYRGGTLVNSGTLTLANRNGLGTGSITVAGGTTFQQSTFEGNGSDGALPNALILRGTGNIIMNMPFSQKDVWLSQSVSGTGGLTVQGGGRSLTLTGDNTFSGGIKLTNANNQIQISHFNALGTGVFRSERTTAATGRLVSLANLSFAPGVSNAFDIASGAYLNIFADGNNHLLLSGPITSAVGIGHLYKSGTATLTLTGANTYTGTTTIAAGKITCNNASSLGNGDLVLATAAKLNLNFNGVSQVASLSLGSVAQANGTYGSTGSAATNKNDTYFSGTGVLIVGPVANGSFTWSAPSDGNWSDSSSWISSAPATEGQAGYIFNFNAAGSYKADQNLNDGFLLNQINFGGSTVTLTGKSLAFSANGASLPQINQNSGNEVIVSTHLALAANTSLGGSGAGGLELTGVISGAGSLTKTTSGYLKLSGANTYTGDTIVNAGILEMDLLQNSAFGGGTVKINSGSKLWLNQANINNKLELIDATLRASNGWGDEWSGSILLSGTSTIELIHGGNLTLSGQITGSGGFTKTGASRVLTLSGINNTYTGTTAVAAGILTCNSASALGKGALVLAAAAKLDLNFDGTSQVASLSLGGVAQANGTYGSTGSAATNKNDTYFSGMGVLNVGSVASGPFTWSTPSDGNWSDSSSWISGAPATAGQAGYIFNFNAAGSYKADQNLNDGFLLNQINFGGSTVTLTGKSLAFSANGASLPQINQNSGNEVIVSTHLALAANTSLGGSGAGRLELTGVISGAGSLTKTTSGYLKLSGVNTYTGDTIVNAGILEMGLLQNSAFGVGTVKINSGSKLWLNQANINNKLELTDATLRASNGWGDEWSGSISLSGTSTIELIHGGNLTLSGQITGSGGFTKTGANRVLTLNGINNTYTGTTTVAAGILTCNSASALGKGALIVATAAKLNLNFDGASQVASLSLGGVAQANGTYGSTVSAATNKNDTYFSGAGTITVDRVPAGIAGITKVTSNFNPATVGVAVTLTAAVTGDVPTGSVSFYSGATLLGTSVLNSSSTASITTSNLAAGSNRITATYLGDATNPTSTSAELIQVVLLAGYETWVTNDTQGLTVGVNDSTSADPDGDGISNLVEFALGGAPMISSAAILPVFSQSTVDWVFEYNRSDAAKDSTIQVVEYSSDLSGWTSVPIPATSSGIVEITPGTPFDRVKVTIPNQGPQSFVRLKVTR